MIRPFTGIGKRQLMSNMIILRLLSYGVRLDQGHDQAQSCIFMVAAQNKVRRKRSAGGKISRPRAPSSHCETRNDCEAHSEQPCLTSRDYSSLLGESDFIKWTSSDGIIVMNMPLLKVFHSMTREINLCDIDHPESDITRSSA